MILGALEQSNLFGPSNKVLYLKKLVIKSGVRFWILFVLVDAFLQKVVYFKNKSGTGVVFLALRTPLLINTRFETYEFSLWVHTENSNFMLLILNLMTKINMKYRFLWDFKAKIC